MRRAASIADTLRTVRYAAWLPPILIAALIWRLSSTPDLAIASGTLDLVLRKIAHIAVFAALAGSLVIALRRNRVPWERALPLAALIGILYAVVDEVHQSTVPTRNGSGADVAIDAFGVGVGVLGTYAIARLGRGA